ncbi:glycosyltransferase [Paenibacillus sp. FSL M7-1455]|uniref:tetratricopeptide repeat-containing glycosyltransferase family 2 protein n=1 Tax=Paenibacillus sp. FSL M7-1455 TaxID=2975316 RepID=UPI0030FC4B22
MNEVSVCMIVFNEEKHIEKSISSVKPYVNEVIVVDHHSTDRTLQIAKDLGARVISRDWGFHFAEARNYCISLAKNPLILVMDADEEMVTSKEELEQSCIILENNPDSAARIEIQSVTSPNTISTSWITRLFHNRPGHKYYGRIHEQLLYSGEEPKIVNSMIKFNHSGYLPDQINEKNKINRNLELLLTDLKDSPDNAYLLFQIGRSYEIMQDWPSAIQYYSVAKEKIDYRSQYFSSLLYHMATTHMKSGRWSDFFEIVQQALNIYPDYTDLYYIYGCGLIESRNPNWFNQIPDAFHACIQLGEADSKKYETVIGVGSFRAHFNLGLYYELSGLKDRAIHHYRISSEQGFDNAYQRLLVLTNKN